MQKKLMYLILSAVSLFGAPASRAQVSAWQETRRGSFYFGVGTSTYADPLSTIHVSQPELNNGYDLQNVKSSRTVAGTNIAISAQLYYNVGYFFNYNQTWAVEFCYLPFNYYAADNQSLQMKGVFNGKATDSNLVFSSKTGNSYGMGSGSAMLQFNIVRRYPLYRNKIRNLSVDLLGKAGFGPVFLNATNELGGNKNAPKLETNSGWNEDIGLGARITLMRHFFGEVVVKFDNAGLNNVVVYDGSANQTIRTMSYNVGIGYTFSTTHNNPMFRKGPKPKPKGLPTGPEPRGDLENKPPPTDQVIENY